MSYAEAPFTVTPNAATKMVALPEPYDMMDIKGISLTVIKTGSNDAVGFGYANSDHSIASFTVSNSTTRKSDYNNTSCVYIQEYNGSSWVDKVVGTVSFGEGEMTFSFSSYDANYYMQGTARGEVA